MDWNAVIKRNREALKRILASLVAMAGIAGFTSPRAGEDGSARRGDLSAEAQRAKAEAETLAEPGEGDFSAGRPTLPRHLHRAVLRLLRPAEAAARRLVIVAARGMVVDLPPTRPRKPKRKSAFLRNGVGTGIIMVPPPSRAWPSTPPPASRVADGRQAECPSSPPGTGGEAPSECEAERGTERSNALAPLSTGKTRPATACRPGFQLFDPLRRLPRGRPAADSVPRISFPGFCAPSPVPVRCPLSPDDEIDAVRLGLRLAALASALDDLPGHARRFARWRARVAAGVQNRRHAAGAQQGKNRGTGRIRRLSPLRPGRPPGQRPAGSRRPAHDVHDVLGDLHHFAFAALARPDTS